LTRTELSRVGEIDRTEQMNVLYEQRGTELVERRGNWRASAWDPDGHGEHSVEAKVHELEYYVDNGGVALGALAPAGGWWESVLSCHTFGPGSRSWHSST
jgi:hypothetical protein